MMLMEMACATLEFFDARTRKHAITMPLPRNSPRAIVTMLRVLVAHAPKHATLTLKLFWTMGSASTSTQNATLVKWVQMESLKWSLVMSMKTASVMSFRVLVAHMNLLATLTRPPKFFCLSSACFSMSVAFVTETTRRARMNVVW